MKVLIPILIGLLVVGCGKKIEDHVEEVGGESKDTEFETVTAMAMSGFPDKQFKLGWMYANGEGVEKDYKEAVKWYRKAAEQGSENAKAALKKLSQ